VQYLTAALAGLLLLFEHEKTKEIITDAITVFFDKSG
jgi:hypothetical protein